MSYKQVRRCHKSKSEWQRPRPHVQDLLVQLGFSSPEVRSRLDLSFLAFNIINNQTKKSYTTKYKNHCSKIQYKCPLESVLSSLFTDIWNGGRQIIKETDEKIVEEKSDWNVQRRANFVLHILTHPQKSSKRFLS